MDPDHRRQVEQRVHVLRAVVTAQNHAAEVIGIVQGSDEEADALSRLSARFGLDEVQALAVLDTQFRRVDRQNARRIAEELAAQQRALET